MPTHLHIELPAVQYYSTQRNKSCRKHPEDAAAQINPFLSAFRQQSGSVAPNSRNFACLVLFEASWTGGLCQSCLMRASDQEFQQKMSGYVQQHFNLKKSVRSLSLCTARDAASSQGSAESVAKSLAVLGQPFCVPLLQPSCPFMSNKDDVHHRAVSHFFMSKRFCA